MFRFPEGRLIIDDILALGEDMQMAESTALSAAAALVCVNWPLPSYLMNSNQTIPITLVLT